MINRVGKFNYNAHTHSLPEKRMNAFIVTTGIVIIIGHYIDVFNMIMPSAVGDQWFIGITEIGGFLFFMGLFIYIFFNLLLFIFLFFYFLCMYVGRQAGRQAGREADSK